MPLYEYQCDACAHRFEVIQKFSDAPIAVCPKCGGQVTKLMSSPAIQFKGTGWYITDYARAGKSDPGAGPGKGESGSNSSSSNESKSEGSSDSKSETKSESKSESNSAAKSDSSSSDSKTAAPAKT
jgi:putative FmdB family regulatory protein